MELGLVTSTPDGRFSLAALGETLRSDVPGSMRDSAIALTAPGHWLPWGRLSEAVRTGRRQTPETLGAELFQYYSDNPNEGLRVHRRNVCLVRTSGGRNCALARHILGEARGRCRRRFRDLDRSTT